MTAWLGDDRAWIHAAGDSQPNIAPPGRPRRS